MKSKFVILMMVLATLSLKAADFPNIIVDKNKSFVLDLNDWKMKNLEVSILDAFGRIVHNEEIQADYSKIKRYDLNDLSSGVYYVKIEDDLKEIMYSILLNNTKIALMSDQKITYKPVVTSKNNKIDINVLALNKTVSVDLYDVEGTNLFSEVKKDNAKYARRLDINTLPKGYYTLQVRFDGELYTHTINK